MVEGGPVSNAVAWYPSWDAAPDRGPGPPNSSFCYGAVEKKPLPISAPGG